MSPDAAFLLATPPPFMEVSTMVPAFVAAYFVSVSLPFVQNILEFAPVKVLTRIIFSVGMTLAITSFGVDLVLASKNYALSESPVGAILHATLVVCAGNVVATVFWLAWTSRTETKYSPLPFKIAPDFECLFCINNLKTRYDLLF